MKLLIAFGYLSIIYISEGHNIVAYLTSLNCLNVDSGLLDFVNCTLVNNANYKSSVNFQYKLLEEVPTVTIYFTISVIRSKTNMEVNSRVMDYCSAIKPGKAAYIQQIIMAEINRSSNFSKSCPLKRATTYELRNFKIDSSKIPPYMPSDLEFELNFAFGMGTRKFMNVTTRGKIVRVNAKQRG